MTKDTPLQTISDSAPELKDIQDTLTKLETRLTGFMRQSNQDMKSLSARLETLEASSLDNDKQESEVTSELLDQVENRISDSEARAAEALEQIGEHVAAAIVSVQDRQRNGLDEVSKSINSRLSDALGNVSERFALQQETTTSAISPIQKAVVSLSDRIEHLEDFVGPGANSGELRTRFDELGQTVDNLKRVMAAFADRVDKLSANHSEE